MNRKMPVIFVGHGSPINALGGNVFADKWSEISKKIPKPKAILSISAHWYTRGNHINISENPEQIYDFYGFLDELYEIKYSPVGDPKQAKDIASNLNDCKAVAIHGLDHGAWCPLRFFFPNCDVPVIPFSVNGIASASEVYSIGRELSYLREEGVVIFCSGNIVHNLSLASMQSTDGFDWADKFDEYIKESVLESKSENIINFSDFGDSASLAVPSLDHYYPLVYAMGAAKGTNNIQEFCSARTSGSISMTSFLWND